MIYFSEPFLSFLELSSARLAMLLRNAYKKRFNAYELLLTPQWANYLDIVEGNLSYLPGNSTDKYLPWSSNKRAEGRPAKVVRKLFTNRALGIIADHLFEEFANSFKAVNATGVQLQLLKNDSIPAVYDSAIVCGNNSLTGSCMQGYGHWLYIYSHCPHANILVARNTDGLLCGRALVWRIHEDTVMDRIYVKEDYLYQIFIRYAIENKWWYKKAYDSRHDRMYFINPAGKCECKRFDIRTPTEFIKYPCIDTFRFGGEGYLTNSLEGPYVYNSDSGRRNLLCLLSDAEKSDL